MNIAPGLVPIGWIKGEPLKVIEPTTGPHGLGSIALLDSLSRAGNGDATPALYYLGSDAESVSKWLDWWSGSNTTDPEPPVPVRSDEEIADAAREDARRAAKALVKSKPT